MRSAYDRLTERLNRFPQGAPPSPLLNRILRMLFSEREAQLVSLLPVRPFTAKRAAEAWRTPLEEAERVLKALAGRGLLVDVEQEGQMEYVLPPPMAGFFEFSLMRVRDDIDQKALAELFYQYLNVEEDFIRNLFTEGETQLGRVFVDETALPDGALVVLDQDRATEVIETASAIGIGVCYCRHKMEHMGRACGAAMDICMTFNSAAQSLTRHGIARPVDRSEARELLAQAREACLVQFGENVREGVNFICNCCGCCCEAMIAARRFGNLHPVHTTAFLPEVETARCTGCGKCVDACPVQAMRLASANDPGSPQIMSARVTEEACLGCGVCLRRCAKGALRLRGRPSRVITPLNSTHRAVVMAIERGKLQNLIFDNQVLWSHRALAAVLGVVLRLGPVKRTMASAQVKSVYMERLVRRFEGRA